MDRRIPFDCSLYLKEAVEAAAAAYAGHAAIGVTSEPDAVVAQISGVEASDLDTIANAFSNYVLQETIVRMRQTTLREAE